MVNVSNFRSVEDFVASVELWIPWSIKLWTLLGIFYFLFFVNTILETSRHLSFVASSFIPFPSVCHLEKVSHFRTVCAVSSSVQCHMLFSAIYYSMSSTVQCHILFLILLLLIVIAGWLTENGIISIYRSHFSFTIRVHLVHSESIEPAQKWNLVHWVVSLTERTSQWHHIWMSSLSLAHFLVYFSM